ncbi:Endonuclease/exonuclease/phosphatase [Mycena galopus ATCC 62051]|nr:Endonuclease/exonuclease/phosphatase [Mycena galopus ATCC 62051]
MSKYLTAFFRSNKLYHYVGFPTSLQCTDQPISLLSWNVDFAAPLPIQLLSPLSTPTIILLQEVHSSCFETLLRSTFIRDFYQITNISSPQSYSTLTLVPKSLAPLVSSTSRIRFTETRMQRDCLYVDLDIPLPPKESARRKVLRIRIANTHLESLNGFGDTARPKQLEVISSLLKATEVDGGLVAGDMNAISPSDQNLHEEVGLSDAWLACTSVDELDTGEAEGHTWGYQPKGQYPPRRLDKILTVGKVEVIDIERVAVGLKVKNGDTKARNTDGEDEDVWVSDHYGLLGKIIIRP